MAEAAKVVMVTQEELEQLVRKAVRAELAAVKPANDTRLLTTQEAAEYLGVSASTVKWHIKHERLVPDSPARPGFKVHRFKRATLDAFMLENK